MSEAGASILPGGIQLSRLAAPVLVILVLAMMVLPLPPLLLDILFTFNIALAMIVLLVGLYTRKPLEFAVFPTVLLVTTLLRLSLNVASTRVVLLEGHTGPDAAGHVIESFGQFLVGGNYAVGMVVFVILVIINFVVITKGAGRIAEVSARFTLDAMPGKQMAIDADLNAGLIGEDEARRRRSEISQEAEFFGAMDGASKFVRGDAVAGIIIMLINILGGLAVGVMQHDMSFADAAQVYTLLTIGDGLVAQVPALIISTAAGLVVSRVGTDEDLNQQFLGQMFNRPEVLFITASLLGLLGVIPGMPHFAFIAMAAVLGAVAWTMLRRAAAAQVAEAPTAPAPAPESADVSWDDVRPVDVLGLEVGYRLVPLVDQTQDGDLLRRIRGLRKKFAQDMGFLVAAVHIRDNLQLRPNVYRILLKGVEVAQAETYPGKYLAINPGRVLGNVEGQATTEPAFGLPAVWITPENREAAQTLGYTVVDPGTVVATHLSHIIESHAAELLGRSETQQLLDKLGKESPKLVEELTPKLLPVATIQKVLQNLLEERVPLRDLRTILETLAEHGARTQDADELTAAVRGALARAIVSQVYGAARELSVIALAPQLEQILMAAAGNGHGAATGLEPGMAERLLRDTQGAIQQQEAQGQPAVLLAPAPLRGLMARFLRRSLPQLHVLAHHEIPDSKTVRIDAVIGQAA
jgi:flagellar biosynthesis protein FlhA